MGVYIFKVGALLEALQEKERTSASTSFQGMMGRKEDIFVYDYEKENEIEDFEVRVRDGMRDKDPGRERPGIRPTGRMSAVSIHTTKQTWNW